MPNKRMVLTSHRTHAQQTDDIGMVDIFQQRVFRQQIPQLGSGSAFCKKDRTANASCFLMMEFGPGGGGVLR